jgi:predicted membrane metal-binding protein
MTSAPNRQDMRIERWERARKAGFLKFVVIRGMAVALFMWIILVVNRAWDIHELPPARFVTTTFACTLLAGLFCGGCSWFIAKWAADHASAKPTR